MSESMMNSTVMWRLYVILVLFLFALTFCGLNGTLQLYFLDVGQGLGALLITPKGETVLFDGGPTDDCAKPFLYLKQLALTKIDYLITSHYHADHLGCAPEIFQRFPMDKVAYESGETYNTGGYRASLLSKIGLGPLICRRADSREIGKRWVQTGF